jgi:hypothetical protein
LLRHEDSALAAFDGVDSGFGQKRDGFVCAGSAPLRSSLRIKASTSFALSLIEDLARRLFDLGRHSFFLEPVDQFG